MLVLTRHKEESVMIGDDIEVRVVELRGDKVRLGFLAPRNVTVHRKEVYDEIRQENRSAAGLSPEDLPALKPKPGGASTPRPATAAPPPAKVPATPAEPPVRLAVLISGGGTTLKNLIDQIAAGTLNARIERVIASRPGIGGIAHAVAAKIPVDVVDRKAFPDVAAFSRAVFEKLKPASVDLVCLGGWLSLLEVPTRWNGRVMNIHPALLPAFGGKGMFGRNVHEAVLSAGCRVSGCTVHFVDATYDTGPIVLQRPCEVRPDDTPETLAARVFEEEMKAYPEAIRLFQQGRLKMKGGRVEIAPPPKG